MKVYKVVRKLEGKLRSAVMSGRMDNDSTDLEYRIGEKTIPKIKDSLLMAFGYIESLQKFTMYNNQEAYLADAEIAEKHEYPKALPSAYGASLETIEEFWMYPHLRRIAGIMEIPDGTVFCKSITLLEKVELVDDD